MGKWAIFGTFRFTFRGPLVDRKDIILFLDARHPYLSNGMNAVLSIFLVQKSTFFVRHFSSVALYLPAVLRDLLRGEPCKNETLLYQMGVHFKR